MPTIYFNLDFIKKTFYYILRILKLDLPYIFNKHNINIYIIKVKMYNNYCKLLHAPL